MTLNYFVYLKILVYIVLHAYHGHYITCTVCVALLLLQIAVDNGWIWPKLALCLKAIINILLKYVSF